MSVTAPAGFTAAGVAARPGGEGAPDLALVVNEGPTRAAAGVFTSHRLPSAPVLWSAQVLRGGAVGAVLLDTANAHACTGPLGFQDVHAVVERTALAVGRDAAQVAFAATGRIGVRASLGTLLPAVDLLAERAHEFGGERAAQALAPAPGPPVTAAVRGEGWTVGGMVAGAAPTSSPVVLTTDAELPAPALEHALRPALGATFHRIGARTAASPGDTALLLASGASRRAPDEAEFADAVRRVCADLARQAVRSAPGATKEIEIEVRGAATEEDALAVGRAIAGDDPLRHAIHREDPDWGRIVAALGGADAAFEPHRLAVTLGGVQVCRDGAAGDDAALVDLRFRAVAIAVDLGVGTRSATVWTTDLPAAGAAAP
ncbi:bifunctional ornithine acetyltransferase/N-acetylglutamate synthase [Streptomyces profundus]|uniref:bifunctional ornithine acetyltransferase/N-acetylglutamate synthase n=1 Tax=Streptomyces profundus TaxID=2867410 RepID=UPI001D1693EF|nr:bifunctional ornithine acetyltransferase/N-acetylglutamate synthase [Streptomyces sp. MA3_2.13]UED83091.1 bifunctional ornithine acetyltransferase/N-acetylglutamate synthase [Streptomyces sp. MA3_2.13]